MRTRMAFLVGVAISLVFAGFGTAQAQQSSIVVDDDRAQCSKATHTSIQAAVQSAAPGQLIWVCPGSYMESVTVDKPNLVIRGVHYGDANQRCQNPAATPDPTLDSVVMPPMDEDGFVVEADGVAIIGFVIRGTMEAGISTSNEHSGYRLEKNVIEDNGVGIHFRSEEGAQNVVRQSCIRRQMGMMDGRGTGILSSDDDGLINALIENNRFASNMSAAIDLSEDDEDDDDDGIDLRNIVIERNESKGDAAFLRVADAENVRVSNDTVRDFGMSGGVIVSDDNVGVVVTNTTLRNGLGPALQTAVETNMMEDDDPAPSTGVRFERNTSEAAMHGVELEPDSAVGVVLMQLHIIASTGDGIVVRDGNDGNSVKQNHVRSSGEDGIHLEMDTSGNTLEQNSSFDNAMVDCRDDGANSWAKNQGETSTPPGICTPNGG